MPPAARDSFYAALRTRKSLDAAELRRLFAAVDRDRVKQLADALSAYSAANLERSVGGKTELADYRTSPYVLMASASVMGLVRAKDLARFLVDTKLYMNLETSFGKQIEAAFVGLYPIGAKPPETWADPPEKVAEHAALAGMSREKRAYTRRASVWREIDKACVFGDRRYLTTIKSGPQTINDTQVAAMERAIRDHHQGWLAQTRKNYPQVKGLDVVIGLTYGTPATTNNKENQILVKLRGEDFEVQDASKGVLVDTATHSIRVYRTIGVDFWAFIGNPREPGAARHTFLEALIGLAVAMKTGPTRAAVLDTVQKKILELAKALESIVTGFPKDLLPGWAREQLSDDEIAWLAASITSFFDDGV